MNLTFLSTRSRGFGFVTFEEYSCVDACLDAQEREPLKMRGKKVDYPSRYMIFLTLFYYYAYRLKLNLLHLEVE